MKKSKHDANVITVHDAATQLTLC